MPIDILTNADNTRIQGSLTVIADPNGNAGNVNIAGTLTASGATVIASNLTVSGTESVTGSLLAGSNLSVAGTETVTGSLLAGSDLQVTGRVLASGNLVFGSSAQIAGGMPAGSATNQVQLLGTSSAGISQTVTMTGSGRVVPVSFTNTSTVSYGLTPTTSTAVSDGAEVTIINISPSGTNLAIPSSLQGSISAAAVITVSAMQGVKFVYSALLQSWLRVD